MFHRIRRVSILAAALCCSAGPSLAARYSIDGLVLGSRVRPNNTQYQSYACRPSTDFADIVRCGRSKPGEVSGSSLSNVILHTADGTVLFVSTLSAPIPLSKERVQSDLGDLIRVIGEQPVTANWAERVLPSGIRNSIFVAAWGDVKLAEVFGDDLASLRAGKNPKLGLLVDALGDPTRSATENLPVYRITGQTGYVYVASVSKNEIGHRLQITLNAYPLTLKQYQMELTSIIRRDEQLPADDYRLWSDVARITRRLARDTTVETANETLDQVFLSQSNKKLASHVWSIVPGGAIEHLARGIYSTVDTYEQNTRYPELRNAMIEFLRKNPSARFSDFLYYALADFDTALRLNPRSIISDVLRYASGHKKVESILREIWAALNNDRPPAAYEAKFSGVANTIYVLNHEPERYGSQPLFKKFPGLASQAAVAKAKFAEVLKDKSSRLADDAAYFSAWLSFHEGNSSEALRYLVLAMRAGNRDYEFAAGRLALVILRSFPSQQQLNIVSTTAEFAAMPAFWYLTSRSLYREFKYQETIDLAEKGLRNSGVSIERLPATTDRDKIDEALGKIDPKLRQDLNVTELAYLLQASREFVRFQADLENAQAIAPRELSRKVRTIVLKYSMLQDPPDQHGSQPITPELSHHDLRQAVHLIDISLERIPKVGQFIGLREWLYYRKIRVLANSKPAAVAGAIGEMKRELPKSELLDDALAEQIYAEGVGLRDVEAAKRTFMELLRQYPDGNAVDNAYTWMAIVLRCEGRLQEAFGMNQEIIRRFPSSRHAYYARQRIAEPSQDKCRLHQR